MTNDDTHQAWHQKTWVRVVLVLFAIWFLIAISFMFFPVSHSNSLGLPAAQAVVTTPPPLCPTCPGGPTSDAAHANDDLSKAVIVDENLIDAGSIILESPLISDPDTNVVARVALTPRCHGRIHRRASLKQPITGFTYGWRQTAVAWCYGSNGVITNTGSYTGNDGAYSGGVWCFQDVDYGKAWWNFSHTEVKVWNRGTLKICANPLPLTKVFYPQIFVHGGTARRPYPFWNYGDRTKIYH